MSLSISPVSDPAALDERTTTQSALVCGPVAAAPKQRHSAGWYAAPVFVTFAALFGLGYLPRQAQRAALVRETARAASAPPLVTVVSPLPAEGTRPLLLPGSIQPLERARIYSRANGYVKLWHVDMGDHVEAGQLLAELDTPEVDREIEQASAAVEQADASIIQARANLEYSRSTLDRYTSLAALGLSSQQELEERKAQASVNAANVRVAQTERSARAAQLRRLEQLGSFARVVAPFAGTVAVRNAERGTLVNAGAGNPLFEIVALDPVRVFVQVPQSLVQGIRGGLHATVEVNEYPGEAFAGDLTRSSGTLDPESRTMKVELRVPNPDGKLLPGMYANVRLALDAPHRAFHLPASAVLTRGGGTVVATVDAKNAVRLLPIEIERDSGTEIEIRTGLTGTERVIRAPEPDVADGLSVQVST